MSAIFATTDRCPRRQCDALMDPSTDGDGRTVWTCRGCERNRAGLCRDCPRRIRRHAHCGVGATMRCPTCEARVTTAREKERGRRRLVAKRKWLRDYRATEMGRAATRRAEHKYRASHPPTDLDRRIRRIRAGQRQHRKQESR
jgi:hypothetical protein